MYVEQFAYDQLGHCANVTTEQVTCRYHYNVFGAVSSKKCSNGNNTNYLVDPFGIYGTNILAEQTASDQKKMYYGQEHGLIATMESSNVAVFYIFDGYGSTVQTASQTGEILISYVYDPFGRVLSYVVNDVNAFRFLAQYGIQIVSETASVVRIRNRLYDTEHGRFISPDPIGVFGSPTNPYAYASNNPLTFKDTNGLFLPILLVPILKVVAVHVAKEIGKHIVKQVAIEAATSAATYVTKWAFTENKKFDWGELADATLTGAKKGFITSVNPFQSKKFWGKKISVASKVVFSVGATLLTEGNILDVLESGAVNFIPEDVLHPKLYTAGRVAIDILVSKYSDKNSLTDLVIDVGHGFIRWVTSVDPNEITGPVGYGDANFISADQSLLYKIEFENNPNATAPAQKVIIRCPIDSNLELGTFKAGLIRFDVYEKDFEYRGARVRDKVDATDTTETFVEIQIFIDPTTKEAVWLLQSIDPLTGLPPSNPLVGFLPPNNGTNGQGHVTFSVDLKSSVQSLTKVTEKASIVFDENPHIDTSTIFHTVDKTAGSVSINVSTLFDGVLFNMVTEDVGSGVKSVDLYLIVDGSVELIKSDINQSVVIVELTGNVLHTVVGVVTDNVGNSGSVDTSGSVGVYVPTDCPANCSGRGQCGSGGVCICDSGYGGYNCSLNVTLSCEPPILEVSHSDSVHNDSLVVFVSARSSQPEPAASHLVRIACEPNDTVISKGRLQSDGVYLDETDFGNVQFTTPDWFYGLLVCTIRATVVDVCGTNVRAVLMAVHVVALTDQTTVKTDTSAATAVHATAPTVRRDATASVMTPITAMTGSVSQLPGEGGRTGSATGTPAYISQPDATAATVVHATASTVRRDATASVMTPITAVTGSVSQSPGVGGTTGRSPYSGTATPAYISQPGDRTSHRTSSAASVTITKVAVTQVSASEVTTTATIWGAWSNWTPCSRTCDNGVQVRTRQCLLSPPETCGPGNTGRKFCQLSPCPGKAFIQSYFLFCDRPTFKNTI